MNRILTRSENGVLYVEFNIPPVNVLGIEDLKTLREILSGGDSRVVVLAGKGKLFCAGLDVKDHLPERVREMLEVFNEVILGILTFPGVVISAVHGGAYGGGTEIALSSDIVIAEEGTSFSQPEVKLGVFPPVACALFYHFFPAKFVNMLIFAGEEFKGEELKGMGVINMVCERGKLMEKTREVAERIAGYSGVAISLMKKAATLDIESIRARLDEVTGIYLDELMRHEDPLEGLNAFLEKRKPVWKHR